MAGIHVALDLTPFVHHLDHLSEMNLRPALEQVGEHILSETLERFDTSTTPDGSPWQPSQRVLKHNGKTLLDTGRLQGSVTYKADTQSVQVGTNLDYAAIHQFGSGSLEKPKNIPARPYLGLSQSDEIEIKHIVTSHLGGAL